MKTSSKCFLTLTFFTATLFALANQEEPPDTNTAKTAAVFLPDTTAIYMEIEDPQTLIDNIWNHRIRKQIEKLDDYKAWVKSAKYAGFQGIVGYIELRLGKKWRPALETLSDGGVYLGIDSSTGGVALFFKSSTRKMVHKTMNLLVDIGKDEAKKKGLEGAVEIKTYRNQQIYRIEDTYYATLERWLMITNNKNYGKAIVDNFLDKNTKVLTNDKKYSNVRNVRKNIPSLWVYSDIEKIKATGAANKLFTGRTENMLAELLFGGILSTLQNTPYATANIDIDKSGIQFSVSTPFEEEWIPNTRKYYFSDKNSNGATQLHPKDEILSLSLNRNLSALWMASPELYDEETNAKIAEAESNLATLFSGHDIASEILSEIERDVQLIVSRQQFNATDLPTPAIKLPSFAIVLQLKDPAKMHRQLKLSFQNLIGFLNIVGAQEGRPQLELDADKLDGGKLHWASYVPMDMLGDEPESMDKPGAIHYNFSPAIGFAGKNFIISSTQGLTEELVKLAIENQADKTVADNRDNIHVAPNLKNLQTTLADNREQLIAQNMLEKGHSRKKATKEVGYFIDILGWFEASPLKLTTLDNKMKLDFKIDAKSL